MNKTLFIILFLLIAILFSGGRVAESYGLPKPKANEVANDRGGIEIPLNYILLIRKDSLYCALKFTRNWIEVDEEERKKWEPEVARGILKDEWARESYEKKYAAYEIYCQSDGSADFSKSNVSKNEQITSWLPLKGPFRPLISQPGNAYIKCGSFKLGWYYKNRVSFIPFGEGDLKDYGFELAPTTWTDIKQINIKDPRIKWYRYDKKREKVFIPIDKLWEK